MTIVLPAGIGGGARTCKDYLRWAKELGAALVLQKPFRMSVLLMMARFLIEKAAAVHPVEAPAPVRALQAQAALAPAARPADFDDLFEDPSALGSSFTPV